MLLTPGLGKVVIVLFIFLFIKQPEGRFTENMILNLIIKQPEDRTTENGIAFYCQQPEGRSTGNSLATS